jgi:ferritin
MLSAAVQQKLNDQINQEAFASHAYLDLATWAESRGLANVGQYFYLASGDERSHMLQLYQYVNANGGAARLAVGSDPLRQDFANLLDVFRYVFDLEHGVTIAINELATWCLQNGEHATFFFLQAFVAEQQASERNVSELISMIERVGCEERNLYYLDKTFKKINTPGATAGAEA